jgi:hypothetical protein
MDGLHVERVAQDEGNAVLSAQVRKPVPTVDALHRDDQVLAEGSDREEEPLRVTGQAAVQQHDALTVNAVCARKRRPSGLARAG